MLVGAGVAVAASVGSGGMGVDSGDCAQLASTTDAPVAKLVFKNSRRVVGLWSVGCVTRTLYPVAIATALPSRNCVGKSQGLAPCWLRLYNSGA